VGREIWDVSDWEAAGKAFWASNDRFATMTDNLQKAQELAMELLQEAPQKAGTGEEQKGDSPA
jgi:hypothetical protein